jgi:hypothetical protein
MDRETLSELWNADAGRGRQNKDRPAFVREHRDALMEHTNTDDPIPEGGTAAELREWLATYKSTVTRQLKEGDNDSN